MGISLYILKSGEYYNKIFEFISQNESKEHIIFITTSKPAEILKDYLHKFKLSEDRFFFIDAVSKSIDPEEKDSENIVYIDSPSNLTELGIAVRVSMENLKGNKLVIFDSLTSLSVYNNNRLLTRFYDFLVNISNMNKVDAVILAVESSLGNLINEMGKMADEVKSI